MSYKPPSGRRMRRPLRKTKVVAPVAPPEPKVSVEELQAILDEEPEAAPEPEVAPEPKLVVTIDELEAVLADEVEEPEETPPVEVEVEVEVETPPVEVEVEAEQAREDDGTFSADDPETPEVNEAFVDDAAKTWSKKSTKAVLLAFAVESGLTDLTNDNTKAEIVAALETAGL